jgi:hypothetical protein
VSGKLRWASDEEELTAMGELNGEASLGVEGRSQGWRWMWWRRGMATAPFYRMRWRGREGWAEGSSRGYDALMPMVFVAEMRG